MDIQKHRKQSLKYYYKHQKECNKKAIEYYYKNRDKILATLRILRKENPDYYNQLRRIQYQRDKLNGKTSHRRLKLRFSILMRDNFTCQYCGRKAPDIELQLQIDHKYPKSKGGLSEAKNYITSCRECNNGKGDCILNEFL